jgi:hypothetical protein
MLNWKLLGDLLPSELKLECEKAGIAASSKDSHNLLKLSKYSMSNGKDPETFYFNTHYQADKTHPFLGMTTATGFGNEGSAKVFTTQARVSPTVSATTPTNSGPPPSAIPIQREATGVSTSKTLNLDDSLVLELLKNMSENEKMRK